MLPGERGKEFKDNKEPSPKMKRRRSVKISGVALEPAAWQNDALQILTSAADYRSMNDFLMKKVGSCLCSTPVFRPRGVGAGAGVAPGSGTWPHRLNTVTYADTSPVSPG